MPQSDLTARASLEYLKKLAKERLRAMRAADPGARLAAAQLEIARDHGFASWRALKAEVEKRRQERNARFFDACSAGNVAGLRHLLAEEPALVSERDRAGSTALHLAVAYPEAVALLLEHGADANARDVGDNALALHFAAGGRFVESARLLLAAGSDVHAAGDLHELEVIGWATVWGTPSLELVSLLVASGARHHAFSAIALGDRELLRRVVQDDPAALRRRLSRYEQGQSVLHYVVAPPDGLRGGTFRTGDHYRTLALLIELGADLEARDAQGRTPLELAMLHGDTEAMRLLHAAGALEPRPAEPRAAVEPSALCRSIGRIRPMIAVTDMERTIAWYRSVGFELGAYDEPGAAMSWASLAFGDAELMIVRASEPTTGLSLWMETERLDELYHALRRRQLERSRAALAGGAADGVEVRFVADLHTAFYGQREFGVLDPEGVQLFFCQPLRE